MSLLAAQGLDVRIGARPICHGLDLVIEPGQVWAVLGPNGAGKTTLLHTLAGLRAPASGVLSLSGDRLAALAPRIAAQRVGLLLQHESDPFPATVIETALIGRHPHLGLWQWEGASDHAVASEALAQMELAGFEHRGIDTLSGGERRRVGLATVLTQDPAVYLLDEPTNQLDLHHQIRLLERLRDHVDQRGGAMVMALHDVNLAARFCDHALLIDSEGTATAGPADGL
ncbi:MAG: ABC transporter, partial [Proteobacteria bacterium SW_6_67_9]